MKRSVVIGLAASLGGYLVPVGAQDAPAEQPAREAPRADGQRPAGVAPVEPLTEQEATRLSEEIASAETGDEDVLLEIPKLSVEEITLIVEDLRAHVALDARLANLLKLTAGADVSLGRVELTIKGVEAQALLKVRLHNVARIIDRTLTTIDRNPELLERLLQSVDNAVGTVGGIADTALQPGGVVDNAVGVVGQTLDNVTQPNGLLAQTVNRFGQTVERLVDQTGKIVERTLDATGKVVSQTDLGSIADLELVREVTDAAGQTLRYFRDPSGRLIRATVDQAGKILETRVLSGNGEESGGQPRQPAQPRTPQAPQQPQQPQGDR